MKLPDVNLLVYAVDESSPWHEQARAWFEAQLSATETVGFAWVVLLAFVRLTTSPRVFESPLEPPAALHLVEGWLDQPCATIVEPTPRHLAVLGDLLGVLGAGGNLTTDAHLGALAIEHGAQLCSTDTDFVRFPGLRWVNPLAPLN